MSLVVIPMGGISARFTRAGYQTPKYRLPLAMGLVFDYSVRTFERYFESDDFLFVVSSQHEADFVRERAGLLGIHKAQVAVLSGQTRGQAETVAVGLSQVMTKSPMFAGEELIIFNIDTFRPDFIKPRQYSGCAYLETFVGSGDGWSFVQVDSAGRVVDVREKTRISRYCCTGLYQFGSVGQFLSCYERELAGGPATWDAQELYVAPLYRWLLRDGARVAMHAIEADDVIFCGVPSEYEFLVRRGY